MLKRSCKKEKCDLGEKESYDRGHDLNWLTDTQINIVIRYWPILSPSLEQGEHYLALVMSKEI